MGPITSQRRANFMKKINDGDKITRALSFSKRKPTLKKKVEELKTLCAVTICMVCFGPDGTVDTYPENAEEVKKEITFYKGINNLQKREFTLLSYLEDWKRKYELKRQKERRKNLDALSGSLSSQIEGLCGDALLHLTETSEKKLMDLKEKIRMLSISDDQDDKVKAIQDISEEDDHHHAYDIVSLEQGSTLGESSAVPSDTIPVDTTETYYAPYASIAPISVWHPMDTNNNIVNVQDNSILSSKCANSLVNEDLPTRSYWDSELMKLAAFEE